jgi:hypothetical protein
LHPCIPPLAIFPIIALQALNYSALRKEFRTKDKLFYYRTRMEFMKQARYDC